ncbi:MAG TPA: flavin reductase family protein [Clostridia bacterium]|jgi:flavin reductase (DIM6/NTAB) family NADH-FMN oxidoreductase RutF|nr:flavin reductase family protein [Clostridia bacterium]HXK73003.1 flavin reductase family protein [Clostridia bacterium]
MKIEMGNTRPEHYKEYWPGQYKFFHHFEFLCGIPSVMYAITTIKENGMPNVCLNAWSSFTNDNNSFYVVMTGISHHCHTYKNIARTGEFVINFINHEYFDNCMKTIEDNKYDTDELQAGGFTKEDSVTVNCPRLKESFLSIECRLEKDIKLTDEGNASILVGKVMHIAADEDYAKGIDDKYSDKGFMFNIHAPKDYTSGEGDKSAVAVCKTVRVY